MLKPQPLANSLALITGLAYLFLYLLKTFAPVFFKLILNSQFFGADIASQVPKLSFANLLGILIATVVVAWIVGYAIAFFYNQFNKSKD